MKIRPKSIPKIKCVLRTDDPNVCKFILNYTTKGKSREMTLDLSVLASQSKLLADLVRANADLPKKVVDRKKLVLELIERGTSNVPELRITKRSGFSSDGQFVLPDMTVANTKPDIFHETYFGEPGFDENLNGSLDEWKGLLGPVCERSNLLIFGILVALTGPLLHCFDPDIGIAFNLAGPSGTGKSTLMRVAQSVLRRADSTDIPTLNGTLTGAEELAYDSNDTFFCLDEFGTSLRSDKKAKEILPFVSYVLCGGVGRRRAKSAAANMGYSHRKWRATLFTASEMPLHEMIGSRFPGEEVRLVEISVPPPPRGGIFDIMGDEAVSQLATKKLAHEAENAISQLLSEPFRHHGSRSIRRWFSLLMNLREAQSFRHQIEDRNGTSSKNRNQPNRSANRGGNATGAADTPAVAVVVRNGKETPRGAWFPADDIEAVLAGAAEMGMHAVKASTPEIISLAQRLPKGRIFDSGKLFTPLIQTKVYDELMAHLPEHGITAKPRLVMSAASSGTGDADAEGPGESVPEGTRPTDWSQITVGSLVLAEEARMEGWFEAIVLEARPKMFSS
jgi:energy-coupling factor transporter ATP-binding protein EcfA2